MNRRFFFSLIGIGSVAAAVAPGVTRVPLKGYGTATRNPIAPRTILYGRCKTAGTITYIHDFADGGPIPPGVPYLVGE